MGAQTTLQQWLPGLEPLTPGESGLAGSGRTRSRRREPRPPSIEKLVASTKGRVRGLVERLRKELQRSPELVERVLYDESSGSFAPAYERDRREVLRLHLEPMLAATVILDDGDRQLAPLLSSPLVPEKLRSQALKWARKSGRRIFLAFPIRNGEELRGLIALLAVMNGR